MSARAIHGSQDNDEENQQEMVHGTSESVLCEESIDQLSNESEPQISIQNIKANNSEYDVSITQNTLAACNLISKNWGSVPSLIREWEISQAGLVITPAFQAVPSSTTSFSINDELTQGFWRERGETIQEFQGAVQRIKRLLETRKNVGLVIQIMSGFGILCRNTPSRITEGDLNKKFAHWTETSKDAMDTSLFSSVGIWTSPNWASEVAGHAATWLVLGLAAILAGSVEVSVWPPPVGNIIGLVVREPVSMIALGVAFVISGANDFCIWVCLSKYSSLKIAKQLMVVQAGITSSAGLIFALASSCNGCFGDNSFFRNEGIWRTLFYLTNGITRGVGAYMLARVPHLSFYVLWLGTFLECISWSFFILGSGAGPFWIGVFLFASVVAFATGYMNLKRRNAAVAEALRLERENAVTYNRVWAKLRSQLFFDAQCLELNKTWNDIMANVEGEFIAKKQLGSNIEDIFRSADALNSHFQEKAKELALSTSGRHIAASVKSEIRALEKVFRVYSGDFSKLADLVRTTIVFSGKEAVVSMNECLLKIASDPEWELIYARSEKIRIDICKNSPSGYRDVQLCVRLKSRVALELGVDKHFCEMQLHIDELYMLKTEFGHKNYIACRNLRGD